MTWLRPFGPGRRSLLVGALALVALFGLGASSHHAIAHPFGYAQTVAVALTADKTAAPTTTTTPSGYSGSGNGPTGIQVGPGNTTTPTTPAPGSGGSVSGGSQPSPGLFDITGHIEAAIDDWFRDLVTAALDPILTLLGHTLLATPNVTSQSRVGQLWQMTEGIADAFLVLFVLVGGAIVMGHETLQTRTAIKDVLPRIVVAAIAVNASLSLAGLAISTADSLSQAVMGQGVDPSQAATVLRQLVLGSLADGGIFVVLVGGVVAVLAMVVLATYIVRLAIVILLVVAAPICLVCHALPQTEGLAKLWWRAFFGRPRRPGRPVPRAHHRPAGVPRHRRPRQPGHRLDRRAGRPARLGLPVLGAGQDPRLDQPVRVLRLAGPFRHEQGGPRRHHLQGRQGPGRRSRAVTARDRATTAGGSGSPPTSNGPTSCSPA